MTDEDLRGIAREAGVARMAGGRADSIAWLLLHLRARNDRNNLPKDLLDAVGGASHEQLHHWLWIARKACTTLAEFRQKAGI